MFWNKKKKSNPLPKTSERELEMVNNLILSMENNIDQWHIANGYNGPRLTRYENLKPVTNPIVYEVATYSDSNSKISFNGAEVLLTTASKKRLNRAARALIEEQLLQSLTINEAPK